MDNDKLFTTPSALTWQLNSAQPTNHLAPPCYLNLNWDQSMDHNTQFESALSSVVSSPSSAPPAAESVVIRELIGRLGSICNSGEISPTSRYHCTNTSGYNTPLSSPPKLNLSMLDPHQQIRGGLRPLPTAHLSPFSADPGFAERAARFSSLGGGRSYSQFGLQEAGKLSRVSSSQALNGSSVFQMGGASDSGNDIQMQDGSQLEMDNAEFGSGSREDSSASERITTGGEAGVRGTSGENNARKRKAAPKAKGKHPSTPKVVVVADEEDFNQKRCKSSSPADGEDKDAIRPKAEKDVVDKKQKKETNGNLPEPPKDYIHVRARRGQATDSHSLAERVRREKISERMKFLQDLVPGCNKVTGKAVMLDEIINYVQSLQKQVEFLSMKLANVNPRLEFNMENFIPKEMNQAHGLYPLESTSTGFSYAHQPQGTSLQSMVTNRLQAQYSANPLESGLRPSLIPHLDGFGDAASQLGAFWEDDLQTVVQMGFGQNQDAVFSSQSLHGSLSTTHMKVEL